MALRASGKRACWCWEPVRGTARTTASTWTPGCATGGPRTRWIRAFGWTAPGSSWAGASATGTLRPGNPDGIGCRSWWTRLPASTRLRRPAKTTRTQTGGCRTWKCSVVRRCWTGRTWKGYKRTWTTAIVHIMFIRVRLGTTVKRDTHSVMSNTKSHLRHL